MNPIQYMCVFTYGLVNIVLHACVVDTFRTHSCTANDYVLLLKNVPIFFPCNFPPFGAALLCVLRKILNQFSGFYGIPFLGRALMVQVVSLHYTRKPLM